jgi:outer membrane protein assembly factor BamB
MTGDFSGKGGFNGSWCTPVVLRTGERDELVLVETARVAAYEPKSGKLLWSCKGLPSQVFASPAVGEGVLVAMGHNIPSGTKVMAVKLGGTGDVSETHRLWETNLRTECIGSGIVTKGCVFLVTQHGIGLCLDLKTGKKLWEERLGNQNGSWSSLLLVNDRLLIMNQSGQVSVLRASPKFERLHTNTIPEETTCSSLAIAGGRVFLRTYESLWCFGRNAPGGGDGSLAVAQPSISPNETRISERKKQVVDLLKSIETGDSKPAAFINAKKYIQHNLAVGDGIEGLVAVLKLLPALLKT